MIRQTLLEHHIHRISDAGMMIAFISLLDPIGKL
jgi:hypothetical protein